jgi:uncharacterized RDD family membrane protein YckC
MEVWIGRDGERHGPYKEEDIRQWLRSGQVSPTDLAWYEGLADWQPLSVLFPDALAATAPTANPAEATAIPPLPTLTAASLEDYAGFWQRTGAWILDYLILLVPSSLVAMNMGAMAAVERLMTQMQAGITPAAITEYIQAVRPVGLVVIVIGFLYYALFECSKWQATPGKMALRLRVTREDGSRIGIGRSMGRNAIRLANAIIWVIPFIFYIAVAWTRRKQGLHDMLAGTLVLNGRASEFKPTPTAGSSDTFSA